jgi:tRNA pseudouridine38-40 synthase
MFRYALIIEYDGTDFYGFQKQKAHRTVQGDIEIALKKLTGEEVKIQAAGRTDKGVHAKGQVVHFDLEKKWDSFRIQEGLNYHLRPNEIAILNSKNVEQDFEARFSAKRRHYEYIILNRRAPPVLERNRVWHVPVDLNEKAMNEAAQIGVGRHDFTTFRSIECQSKSPIKSLDYFSVRREDNHIIINANALSFLHHQVRSLVGSIKLVGQGKWSVNDFKLALEAKDRSRCGTQAPSAGLYLMRVDY